MIASDILDRCSAVLGDPSRVRWTASDLLSYLTDAMRQTVLIRPDANAVVATVQLTAANTRQAIPSDAVRFLSLVRNMGAGGLVPGSPITPTTREAMDAASAAWHVDTASSVIDHYLYNQDTPSVFYVYPKPATGTYVEMEYARDVGELTSVGDTLPLAGIWAEPLREYVMYRAYSRNVSSVSDKQTAANHLRQFYLALGEESRAKALFNPYQPTFAAPSGG